MARIDPQNIVVVSVMPCTAKKFEARRPELGRNGMADVDVVITTGELARMIKEAGIDFVNLPDEDFDSLMGESTRRQRHLRRDRRRDGGCAAHRL